MGSNHMPEDERLITIHISLGSESRALFLKIGQLLKSLDGAAFLENGAFVEPDEILTPDDLANVWKVPKSKIYALTMQKGPGSIPRFKIGRHLRFRRCEVEKWADEQDKK